MRPFASSDPTSLSERFDEADAVSRIQALTDAETADALLDQHAVAGIGNIFKSESLFVARVDPFARVGTLAREDVSRVVDAARRLMRASAVERPAEFSVYGRGGKPCRRCGTPISQRKQGENARVTYWCTRCQPASPTRPTKR